MNSDDVPIANPIVVLREEFDDWAVLFNSDTASAVGTNPVGVAIWKLMDGIRSVKDIATEIGNGFTDLPVAAPKQIADFVNTLAYHGFVGLEQEIT